MATTPGCTDVGAGESARVLIVEGDDPTAARLAALLDAHGFTPLPVIGPVGPVAAQVFEPDAVVLGLDSVGTAGEEALRVLTRSADPRPRILVLARHPDLRDRVLALGVDACLVDPVDPDELIAWVRGACAAAGLDPVSPS